MIVSLAAVLCLTPDVLRWATPLVELLRYRHAQLWSEGYTLKRVGRTANRAEEQRRERFEAAGRRWRKATA